MQFDVIYTVPQHDTHSGNHEAPHLTRALTDVTGAFIDRLPT